MKKTLILESGQERSIAGLRNTGGIEKWGSDKNEPWSVFNLGVGYWFGDSWEDVAMLVSQKLYFEPCHRRIKFSYCSI